MRRRRRRRPTGDSGSGRGPWPSRVCSSWPAPGRSGSSSQGKCCAAAPNPTLHQGSRHGGLCVRVSLMRTGGAGTRWEAQWRCWQRCGCSSSCRASVTTCPCPVLRSPRPGQHHLLLRSCFEVVLQSTDPPGPAITRAPQRVSGIIPCSDSGNAYHNEIHVHGFQRTARVSDAAASATVRWRRWW